MSDKKKILLLKVCEHKRARNIDRASSFVVSYPFPALFTFIHHNMFLYFFLRFFPLITIRSHWSLNEYKLTQFSHDKKIYHMMVDFFSRNNQIETQINCFNSFENRLSESTTAKKKQTRDQIADFTGLNDLSLCFSCASLFAVSFLPVAIV